jgi:hypothetical protein
MLKTKFLSLLLCVLTWLPLQAAESGATGPNQAVENTTGNESTVKFFNRDIVTFRSSLYGVTAQDRARRAQLRMTEQLKSSGPHQVTEKLESLGIMLQIDGETTFWITPDDANKLSGETPEALAKRTITA